METQLLKATINILCLFRGVTELVFESVLIYMHRGKAGMCKALYFLLGKGRLLLGPSGAVSGLKKPRSPILSAKGKCFSHQPSWWPSNEFAPVSQCLCCTGGGTEVPKLDAVF